MVTYGNMYMLEITMLYGYNFKQAGDHNFEGI